MKNRPAVSFSNSTNRRTLPLTSTSKATRERQICFPREIAKLLLLSVLSNLEILPAKIGNQCATFVVDVAKHVDQVNVHLDGGLGLVFREGCAQVWHRIAKMSTKVRIARMRYSCSIV